ncbi:MAG: DegT/DnrJ/EryC1/StrS family aminotransferase, partial [Acidobacteriota bacterium]
MHIRINIPAWGGREIARGIASFASRDAYRNQLLEEIAGELHPFKPQLVSSARCAIALAVRMLGLEGRRVAVPGYVCPAVITALRAARVEAVAVDCEPASLRFDAESLARADADGVLAANTYGLDQDFSMLARLRLPVIEDAAYQAGSRDAKGAARGTRADAGVWSFNFKSLTAVGGGVLIAKESVATDESRSHGVKEAARFFNYALRSIARHRIPKFFPGAEPPSLAVGDALRDALTRFSESVMSELQAAVALAQWQRREKIAARQLLNSTHLYRTLSRCEAFALVSSEGETLPHLFPLLVRGGAKEAPGAVFSVRQFLHRCGIQTETPYPMLGSREELPNAYDLASRLILVPCNASLDERQTRFI